MYKLLYSVIEYKLTRLYVGGISKQQLPYSIIIPVMGIKTTSLRVGFGRDLTRLGDAMQPFELPDFYVPWPARLNPNLDAARVHSKVWAHEMGILGLSQNKASLKTWDEHAFDRHDYALFCGYIHPEAPSPELNLMTDWNVWGFYVDDYFLRVYKQSNDHIGGKKYLDRIPLFMPVDLSSPPMPTNPMERGLSDLWLRTAPTKSEAWRCRIAEDMRSLWDAFLWELDSMGNQRIANPIEYIEMRRQVGAALWSADLVEHAMFVEIPERIAATRPMRVLKNTFADAAHLRNDIFSYEREVLKDGELTNAVLVIERFLGVDTQRAVNLVNDLLTSRLQQFEHILLAELPSIFLEYALDSLEQANVLNYIRGLQDWQSGAHEWHIQTSRYLNPGVGGQTSKNNGFLLPGPPGFLGSTRTPHEVHGADSSKGDTSVMRLTPGTLKSGMNRLKNYAHVPHKKVGPTHLPKFYKPFTTSINPHLETARRHAKAWARQMGMLDALPTHPRIFIWDEHRFDVTDLAFFNALLRPNATFARLELMLYWDVLGTYTDDYFPAVYGRTHDVAGAKLCHIRLSEFMPIESTSPTSVPLTPVERGLADVWMRSTKTMSVDERRLFRKVVEEMIGSWVWELFNQAQNRIPDPIDYIEMRRKTSGSDFVMVLPHSAHDQGIPPEVYRTLTMQELHRSAVDCVCLTNDIFSYQKEIEFEGDIHNCVLVIESFLGCDKMQAVEFVNNLITARMKQFEYIVTNELPILFENFDLGTQAREQLLAYVIDLQHFMSGALQWHLKTERYNEAEIRRRPGEQFIVAPTGLGTAGARMQNEFSRRDEPSASSSAQTEEDIKVLKTFAVSHLAPPFLKKKEETQAD
jgi:germacradienol/geosmin synthase